MVDLGKRLGDALKDRYDVQRELGRGGAAVVYLAEDLKHHRPVAIKVMKPELAAALGGERFLREIEIAARLNHPNILSLHDSGEADGLLYFVMPYIEGESLRDRVRREGQLPLEDAVQITCEVGDALSYAHDQGLIHRDVKPENILFQAGHALVSDFGIARAISEAGGTGLTETGMAVGTIAYMSPEQATGESDLDAQTDVYGLGCVLFEMLAGASPYGGKTPQAVMAQKLVGAVPGLRTEREEIPPTVEAVVEKALAKELAERFATSEQFTGALKQAITARAIEEDARIKRRAQRWRSAAWTSVVTALAAGWWWVSTLAGGPTIERLAVLPLMNVSGNPEQDFFAEGAHAAIISELQMAGVGVIARRSVLKYRDTEMPIREIAEERGLDAILEASMSLDGDSVTIDARLVDGQTEEYLWARSFRTDMRHVVGLYRDLTRAIASEIRLTLTPQAEARLAASPEVDPEAYAAYLKGVASWHELTPAGLERALQYFEFALEIEPDYALAYAGIAQVAGARNQMGLIPYEETRPIVESAARQAVQLDSTLAEVHYTLAVARAWGGWDWAGSEQAFRRAIELNPNSPEMRAYFSHHLFTTGRAGEAMAQITRALELDPVDALYQGIYGMDLMYEHRYEEAIETLERALLLEPDAPILLSTLRSVYHLSGRYDDAMDAWRASYASTGDTEAVDALNSGFEDGGYAGALGLLAQTMVERSRTTFVTPWRIGTMLTRAGRLDEALDWLERAFEAHDPNVPYLTVDPIFDGMRDDPRFRSLIEGLKLPS